MLSIVLDTDILFEKQIDMEREKTSLNIGQLEGKVLVFGGVYSNLQALEQMQGIAAAEDIAPENIICTGDVVGYCAQPEEVVQGVRDWGVHCIAGNVEVQLREGQTDCGCEFGEGSRCDIFSMQWFPFAQDRLSAESIQWMESLTDFIRFEYAGLQGLVVHGSYFKTAEYVFASTPWEQKARNFAATGIDLILAGHCGLPFSEKQNGQFWLNPGVIGMPANDGTTRVWYQILDDADGLQYAHHSFEYDHALAAQLMSGEPLPQPYAHTLVSGVWDNCEILPAVETALQGKRIGF